MTDHSDDEFDPADLARLRDAAKALPRDVAPTADAWPAIRSRIESARVRELVPNSAPPNRIRARDWRMLAVAATLLIAVTTVIVAKRTTARVVIATPSLTDTPTVAVAHPETVSAITTPSVPARAVRNAMSDVFDRYDVAAKDLVNDLQQRRERLDPATVAVLDNCLRTIDNAIAESRETLSRAPDNATVAELLEVTYQQKLDLLRRAAELPQRTL